MRDTVSISTEQHAATIRKLREPEMLFPVFGKDAKSEKKEIVESYPEVDPGRRQKVLAVDRDRFLYCIAAAEYWDEQKGLAANVIRRILGDAEYGFTGKGVVFVQRRVTPRKGFWTDPTVIDALHSVKR